MNIPKFPITVVVLTYNEEANLEDCLASVRHWAQRIFVVDSGSTDGTREIAARFGAELLQHPFETHAKQWNWALENLPIQSEWVLALDADQRVTPELAREIGGLDTAALRGVDGIYIKRRQIFRDKWIKHGGYYPKYLLKMFRLGSVRTDARDLVDHHFYVPGKPSNSAAIFWKSIRRKTTSRSGSRSTTGMPLYWPKKSSATGSPGGSTSSSRRFGERRTNGRFD